MTHQPTADMIDISTNRGGENLIGKQISVLFRQLNLYFNRQLSGISISVTELLYLSSLYTKDGISQDDLAQEYSVDKAAVTRTLQLMEKKELIIRKTDRTDKRSKKLFLTDKAKSLETELREIQAKWVCAMTKGMEQDVIDNFSKQIDTMVERAKELNKKERADQE